VNAPITRLAGLIAGAAVLAVLLAGCHRQPDRLDMTRAVRQIGTSLQKTYHLPVTDLRCPTKVDARKGATFPCTLAIAGHPLTVTITQRTGQGDLRVTPTSAVLVMAEVRPDMVKTLAAQLHRTKLRADCGGQKVRVVAPRGSFECVLADGIARHKVTVRVTDATGTLTYTLH